MKPLGAEYPCHMSVVGQWRRSVLGAGGVALLLPLGLALGVALTTAFGGGDTLRALGQVFAGPSAPVGGVADTAADPPKRVPQVPVRRHPAVARPVAPATPSTSSTPTSGGATSGGSDGNSVKPTPTPTPT